jgi:hypothetical protein
MLLHGVAGLRYVACPFQTYSELHWDLSSYVAIAGPKLKRRFQYVTWEFTASCFQYQFHRAESTGTRGRENAVHLVLNIELFDDFLCIEARIVVEVDGEQHLSDANAYRRDRRKDRLLKENGYIVLDSLLRIWRRILIACLMQSRAP